MKGIKEYTVVDTVPELPEHHVPTPSRDGLVFLLRGLYDGLQLTSEEAKQWMKDNAGATDET